MITSLGKRTANSRVCAKQREHSLAAAQPHEKAVRRSNQAIDRHPWAGPLKRSADLTADGSCTISQDNLK